MVRSSWPGWFSGPGSVAWAEMLCGLLLAPAPFGGRLGPNASRATEYLPGPCAFPVGTMRTRQTRTHPGAQRPCCATYREPRACGSEPCGLGAKERGPSLRWMQVWPINSTPASQSGVPVAPRSPPGPAHPPQLSTLRQMLAALKNVLARLDASRSSRSSIAPPRPPALAPHRTAPRPSILHLPTTTHSRTAQTRRCEPAQFWQSPSHQLICSSSVDRRSLKRPSNACIERAPSQVPHRIVHHDPLGFRGAYRPKLDLSPSRTTPAPPFSSAHGDLSPPRTANRGLTGA